MRQVNVVAHELAWAAMYAKPQVLELKYNSIVDANSNDIYIYMKLPLKKSM
jgi:hypothetical protein